MATPRRQFIRRTKPTSSPETTTESEPTTDTDTKKFQRGPSKFKSRKEQASQKDVASQTAESRNTSRPFSNTGARRSERPITRNFARRRPEGNVSTSTSSSSPATVTRRPFRVASRRRPSSSTTAATTTTTAGTTTLVLESDELLQDIGDIDAIEDPTLEPRAPKKTPKIQRRPLVNLKEDKTVDQNPSATNEDTKRQSKKYSSSFRQNQLDGLLKKDSTTEGTTVEDYNAETALAIATHQLITAPIPITTDYDETPRKPTTRTIDNTKTTDYTYTTPDFQATRTYDITKETTDIDTGKVTFEATYVPTNEFTDFTTPRIPSTFFTTPDGYTGIQRGISTTPGVIGYTGIQRGTPSSIEVTGYTGIQRGITASTPEVTGYTGTQRGITASTPEVTGYTGIQRGTTASAPEVTGYTGTQRGNTAFTPEVTGYTGTQRGNTAFTPEVTGYTGTQRGNTAFTTEVTGYTGTQRGNTAFTTEVTGYTGIQRGTPRTKVATPEVTGYTGIQRGGVKYSEHVTDPSPTLGFPKTSPISQDPNYLTREYLLASPVTKTYDDEYQYLSPTTTQMPRKVFRKKIQRRISTTQRPTTPIYVPKVTTPRNYLPEDTSGRSTLADRTSATYLPEVTSTRAYLPEGTSTRTYLPEVTSQRNYVPDVTGRGYVPELNRKAYVSEGTARNYVPEVTSTRNYLPEVSSVRNYLPEATSKAPKPFEKVNGKTYKPVVSYDYYDDSAERVALKYAEGTKVILHGKGSIECLDVGNFPHPSSCKKFISCARMEFGSLLGWEYICPKGLSFDPVGGICNWSAGLGCDEKDV